MGGAAFEESRRCLQCDLRLEITPVKVYAGEFEMEALASGALRVLTGQEKPKTYTGVSVWDGFER